MYQQNNHGRNKGNWRGRGNNEIKRSLCCGYGCFVMYEREKTLCEGGQKGKKADNSRHPSEINLDPRLIWCVWVEIGGWILNLRQEL